MAKQALTPDGKPIPKGHVYAYDRFWPTEQYPHPYMVELALFNSDKVPIMPMTGASGRQYPGRIGHYHNFVDMFWGEQNKRKSFQWHPWAEQTIEEVFKTKILAIGGTSGSGKSFSLAPYAIASWLADPMNTIVIIVSTTVSGAKKRIWGYIEEFWNAIPVPVPGKIQASFNQIVPFDGKKVVSQRTGIFLVAGEKGSEKESSDKIMGFHAQNVILILDELPFLSQALVKTALSNTRQNPNWKIIGLGNPSDYFDPFSMLAEPEMGWQDINVDSVKWKTKLGGTFLHFDSVKCENILKGRTIYPYLPKLEEYNEAKERLGENSAAFWSQWRGFWPPEGAEDGIYSQAEIIKYSANVDDVEWAVNTKAPNYIPMPNTASQNVPYAPVKLAFLDLGLVTGGDRCCLYFAEFGLDREKKPKIRFLHYKILHEDVSDRINPREVQIVQAFRRECEKEGIHPSCAGYDHTGGGVPYRGFIDIIWSKDVIGLPFGGKPTELPVSDSDKTKCCDYYYNHVTEIWFSTKWLIRAGMVRGMGVDLIDECCKRKYTTAPGVNLKLKAESKADMKKRMGGKSCDIADAAFGLVALIRRKYRFNASNASQANVQRNNTWSKFLKKNDVRSSQFDTGYQGSKRSLDYSAR